MIRQEELLKARQMWQAFTDDEKMLVRFGMFPAVRMAEAQAEGFDDRELVLGLMAAASADGGMVA
jgi:hypothetical protein